MPSTKPVLSVSPGAVQSDTSLGSLKFHRFDNSRGFERVRLSEHALFLLGSRMTSVERWQGERQPSRDWEPGDLQFMPAKSELSTDFTSSSYSETLVRIPQGIFERACADFNLRSRHLHYLFIDRSKMIGLTEVMLRASTSAIKPPALVIESMTIALAAGVGQIITGEQTNFEGNYSHRRIGRAVDFIEANLSRDMSLEDISAAAAMSPFHFTKVFKRAMGSPPVQYVWQRRIEMARRILTDRRLPLADVAMACGFNSQSSFTTSFRRATGMTPGAYRAGLI